MNKLIPIIHIADYKNICIDDFPETARNFMTHYIMHHSDEIYKQQESHLSVRNKYREMINADIFLDMTLTYDFVLPTSFENLN